MPVLIALGQGLLALGQFLLHMVGIVLLWLLGLVLKRPLQSAIVLMMLVVLVAIHRAGPNNPAGVENAIRLVLPIALLLVAITVCRRFMKPPKL